MVHSTSIDLPTVLFVYRTETDFSESLFMRSPRIGFAALVLRAALAAMLSFAGCSGSGDSSPKVISRGLMSGSFDLVVGHSHHVREAMTDSDDADAMVKSREGIIDSISLSPGQLILALYKKDSYRHYGNAGEEAEPLCKVDDQDPVDVDGADGVLNVGQPKAPVSCTLSDGTALYVTVWDI